MVEESTGTAGLGLRGGTHSSSVVPRVATGTVVCGDGGTCGVWGLSAVLGTGNSGVTRASEAGLTSPAGIAECWSVSAGFAAATKAERFRRSVPFLSWQGKIRLSQFSRLSPGHTELDLLSKLGHLVQVLAVPLLYDACQSCAVGSTDTSFPFLLLTGGLLSTH